MAEFDYSQYDNGDDYTTVDAIYDMIHQANNTSRPMSILLECYNKYENHIPEADAIANDKEALNWLDDYWEYVCSVEHGNQGSIEEIGGFIGMAETITNPEIAGGVIDYLQYDDEIDEDAQNLIDRLRQITSRYNGVSKMKKSSYEDLVSAVAIYNDWMPISNLRQKGFDDSEIMQAVNDGHLEMKYDGKYVRFVKSAKKMKKSAFDNIPQTFYINLDSGRSITFSKEEYPLGVRWLHDDKNVRFYTTDGEEVFPVLQFSESSDHKALMLFEEKDWADDYYGKYTDATGTNAVIEFEDFINDVLSNDVYVDYGDEDIMESTKKSIPSIHDMITQTRANNNSLVKSRVDLNKQKTINKSNIDWDSLVEKGQKISQLLEEIKSAVINNHGGSSNEDSIINIINEMENQDLIYNLNWNLVSARTYHRHDE